HVVARYARQFGSHNDLLSPSQMLMGGKSRAVAKPTPENNRFISLCMRRISAKGSKPIRGKSESAMISPSVHVHPVVFTLTHVPPRLYGVLCYLSRRSLLIGIALVATHNGRSSGVPVFLHVSLPQLGKHLFTALDGSLDLGAVVLAAAETLRAVCVFVH